MNRWLGQWLRTASDNYGALWLIVAPCQAACRLPKKPLRLLLSGYDGPRLARPARGSRHRRPKKCVKHALSPLVAV